MEKCLPGEDFFLKKHNKHRLDSATAFPVVSVKSKSQVVFGFLFKSLIQGFNALIIEKMKI